MKNKHLKRIRAWVKALKSGDYKQTTDQLYDGKAFCCLGVATDLYLKDKGKNWKKETDTCYGIKDLNGEIETADLPSKVWYWLGADTFSLDINYGGESRSFAILNDTYGLSFKEIAKLIEKKYLKKN